jgi:signal transduction histidine kinase
VRVRLQGIVLTLVALLVFGLGIPLAATIAASAQQKLFLDRLTDTARFASLAQRPLLDNKSALIDPDLRRYTEVYGVQVVVFDQDGTAVDTVAGPDAARIDVKAARITGPVHEALAGRRSQPGGMLLPWNTDPLVLAEPVLADGEVRGAVVTVSDTTASRTDVLWWFLLLTAGGVLAFVLALAVAIPVVRWILRPVKRLDDATGALVASVVGGRAAEPVGEGGGPPELRQLGRSFDRMAESVSGALEAQRVFVADASHQLRNPLTALKIRLGNLEGHVDDEPAAADLEAARIDAGRLHQILDGLLSMARAEASGGELDPLDLAEAVADRVADWSVVGEARDVRLVVDPAGVAGDGVRVRMPPRGAETILDALLDNALKFTAAGTEIRIGITREGDEVRLSVRDHGPGLRPDELDRALDRFWRSSAHQNVPGSGLGLAIVSEIVAHSYGKLALDLPDGGGLRITMTFPAG